MRRPAAVRFVGNGQGENGKSDPNFTLGRVYPAYFLEYSRGRRSALHVSCDGGTVFCGAPLERFEVILDLDGALTTPEAVVRCVKPARGSLTPGRMYRALGYERGRDGSPVYLVEDDSGRSQFYPAQCFEILVDHQSVLAVGSGIEIYAYERLFCRRRRQCG
ncbi:MAG: hypothetical protein PHD32_01915 [Eubacteriales bacterium]|nr:hypothetical protein [Eubacteriales bacterium]